MKDIAKKSNTMYLLEKYQLIDQFYNNIDTHPSDEHIKDKHFIVEFGPIVLEWR